MKKEIMKLEEEVMRKEKEIMKHEEEVMRKEKRLKKHKGMLKKLKTEELQTVS